MLTRCFLTLVMTAGLSLTAGAATFPYHDVNPQDCSETAKQQRGRAALDALNKNDVVIASRLFKEAVNCHFSGA